MKTAKLILWLIAAAMIAAGCTSEQSDEMERTPTPELRPSHLEIVEGDTASSTVHNATLVSIETNSRPDLFDAEAAGMRIIITGIAPGDGELAILADGKRLTLYVSVAAADIDDSYDFSAELSDSCTRFTSPELTIRYDNAPGVMAARHTDGLIELRDLGNGNVVNFNPDGDKEGELPTATLTINGVATPLESCTLQRRCENGDRWYSMRRHGCETHAVLVVTDL